MERESNDTLVPRDVLTESEVMRKGAACIMFTPCFVCRPPHHSAQPDTLVCRVSSFQLNPTPRGQMRHVSDPRPTTHQMRRLICPPPPPSARREGGWSADHHTIQPNPPPSSVESRLFSPIQPGSKKAESPTQHHVGG